MSYDHPFNAPLDHALNIDFVNEAQGPGARGPPSVSATIHRSFPERAADLFERFARGRAR